MTTAKELGTEILCGRCGHAFKPDDEIERGYCTHCLKEFWWAKMWLTRMEYDGDWRTIKISEYEQLGNVHSDIEFSLYMGKKMRRKQHVKKKRKGGGDEK